MAIIVTPEEKAQLQKENTLIRALPGATGSDHANYHNPVTGQEMSGPMDPYHMTRRLRQGWRLGPAPSELRAKWIVREQELKEADDLIIERHKLSDEGRQEREVWEQNFSDAVATAVTQVLEKLGVDLPNAGQTPRRQEEEEAETEVETNATKQLKLFVPNDAPSESDMNTVSPASRPEIHLVE